MNKTPNHLPEWESIFIQQRPYLLSFSFRMTGSLTEAEDIVQDTFLACLETDPRDIKNHKSWLTKVCSNKTLDHLKLAHRKRETYPGVWLPDAVPDSFQYWKGLEDQEHLDKNLVLSESLTTTFLLILQKLNPEERVVYLLSDIFDYSFKDIASFLSKSEDACKKIAQRARKAFDNQKRFNPFDKSSEEVITRFFDFAKKGDSESLSALLAEDSEFWADGGGKVSVASQNVITDKTRISRFFAGMWSSKILASEDIRQEIQSVNSRTGLVVSRRNSDGEWVFETLISFEVENGRVARIYTQRNPEKLSGLMKE